MKKFLRIAGISVLVLVGLIVGTIVYLLLTVDMEAIKQRISAEVQKQTGRELRIAGELGLSFFPWVGIEVGRTQLGNAAGFEGDFASFERAVASVKLMPLFSKQVEMSTLTLDGFTLNLHQRRDGVNNWDDLARAAAGQPAADKPAAGQPGPGPMAAGFLLDGIEISNAKLSFRDDQAKTVYSLTDFNLSTRQIGLKRDVPFTAGFAVVLSEPALKGAFDLQGVAYIDPAGPVKIRDIVFNSRADLEGQPVSRLEATLKSNVTLDQQAGRLTASPLEFTASLSGPALPEQPTVIALSTSVTADLKTQAATLKPLNLQLPGSKVEGEVAYRPEGRLKLIDFNLACDQIDLNRLAPPVAAEPAPAAPAPAKAKPAEGASEALRSLVVNGDVTVGRIVRDQLLVSEVALRLKLRDAQLRVHPFTAKLYGGLASNDISVDLRPAAPLVKAKADLQGFRIGEYLKAAMDKDLVSGTANVSADLGLSAGDAASLKRSLNGTAALSVRDGALQGVNIPDMIRRAKAALAGQTLPPASTRQTDFTELSATAQISDGLVRNNDLLMKSPLLRINGAGEVSLPAETIDYRVRTTLVSTTKGQEGASLEDLVGLPIPIRITGSFAKPEWQIDLKSALEEKVKGQVKGVLEEAVKDPQKALQDPKQLLESPKKSLEGLKQLFK